MQMGLRQIFRRQSKNEEWIFGHHYTAVHSSANPTEQASVLVLFTEALTRIARIFANGILIRVNSRAEPLCKLCAGHSFNCAIPARVLMQVIAI